MTTINITKDSYFLFSGGEVHSKLNYDTSRTVKLLDYSMNGLMALAQLVQIYKRQWGTTNLKLIIPYLPYARQDRWISDNEPFSLKLYCDMINTMNFESVTVWDCHSDVGLALLNNCINIPQHELVKQVVPETIINSTLTVSPDAGAYKKVSKLQADDSRLIVALKQRDESGNIIRTSVMIHGQAPLRDCFVVDDICDGGRTFIELGKALKETLGGKNYLYVTHGIFSKGLETISELRKYYEHIYTTDSFGQRDYWKDDVTVVDVL